MKAAVRMSALEKIPAIYLFSHGVTPFEIETGDAKIQHPGLMSWSHYFGSLTVEMMKKHPETLLVCPAMIKGSHLEEAFQNFPTRSFDVGINEEHALTMAGALSLNGFHPIVSVYSTFLQRAYDQLSHDCARMNTDLTLLIDRSGFVGADGSTHMGLYDEAFLKSIPNITLTMPSSFAEARYLYQVSLEAGHGNDPTYKGTDHTREKVPLLVYSPSISQGKMLEERSSFADIGATVLDNFGIEKTPKMIGESIKEILR